MPTEKKALSTSHERFPSRTQSPIKVGGTSIDTNNDLPRHDIMRQRYLGNHFFENLTENQDPDTLPSVPIRSTVRHPDGLALASIIGNRGVGRLLHEDLQSPPPSHRRSAILSAVLSRDGQPLDPAVRASMECRFGHDFSRVRLHTNESAGESARMVHARAYTVGHDVVFGTGQYTQDTFMGRRLLAHELVHVVQQERGGSPPELDPGAAHEKEADTAATAIAYGSGPVSISGATPVGLARSVDDWLQSTPDVRMWSYTQILDEIDEIQGWLDRQIESSEESTRLEEVLETLRAEAKKRQRSAMPSSKGKARRRRRQGRRGKDKQHGDDAAQVTEPELTKPRILREETSFQYDNVDEMREEIDSIMAWLQRKDLTPDERNILQTELLNLAPSLQENRVRKAAERRANKIQRALTPKVSGDARIQLVEVVKLIEKIQPLTTQPGYSYLMHENEMIVLSNAEVETIRDGIAKMMDGAARAIEGIRQGTFDKWAYQAKIDREESFAGFVVSMFTKTDASDIFDRMNAYLGKADNHLSRYHASRRRGDLVKMAQAIGMAEENVLKARVVVDKWVGDVIATGENIVTGLTITRDLSFAIVTSYFGGAGFASLARSGAGLVKAGLTVTAVGAGSNALVRGGSNLAGQALTGAPIDIEEVKSETITGAKRGAVDALTGVVTAGTGSALGQGTTTTGRIARGSASGFAGGATGSGVQAVLEGKSAREVISSAGKGGVSGVIGGGLGGATNAALGSRSAVTRVLVGSGSGAASDATGAWIAGGSAEDIKQAAITGAITGGVTAGATPEPFTRKSHRRSPQREEYKLIKRDVPDQPGDSGATTPRTMAGGRKRALVRPLDRDRALSHHLGMDEGQLWTGDGKRVIRVSNELYDAAWQRATLDTGRTGTPPPNGFVDGIRGQVVLPSQRRPDILDPGGELRRGTKDPQHYHAREYFGETMQLGLEEARYFADANLRAGGIVDLDFGLRTQGELGVRRSSRLRGQEEFNNALAHFRRHNGEDSVKGIRGDWDKGDNLSSFNERFKEHLAAGSSQEEAFRRAAMETHTGRWARAAGFTKVRRETDQFNPDTKEFEHVAVVFEKGPDRSAASSPSPSQGGQAPRHTRTAAGQAAHGRAQKHLLQTLSSHLKGGGGTIPVIEVEGVKLHDVKVALHGTECRVGYFGIENVSGTGGHGLLVHQALEQATIDAAVRVGARSARVMVEMVVNPRWQNRLESLGYTKFMIPHSGGKVGFKAVMSKVFPVSQR